jgi:hypothetical protein
LQLLNALRVGALWKLSSNTCILITLLLGHTIPSTSWRMLNLLHIHLPHVLPIATLQLLSFLSLVFSMMFHHHPIPQCLLIQQN